jgi:hypothetical protein
MEVIVGAGQRGIKGDMSDDVGEGSFVSGVLFFEGIESFRDATVVSSPLFSYLGVENLSNRHNCVRSSKICSYTTSDTSNDGLLSGSEIIGGFDGFCLVINEFIEGVSYSEISQSGDEVGFETLVEA